MEQSNKVSGSTKEHDSLIALSRAKTVAGQQAVLASANSIVPSSQENAAPIGPIQVAVWTANGALTPKVSGKFDVKGTISGLVSAVDLPVNVTLTRNGVPIGPTVIVPAGHVAADISMSLAWTDDRAIGSAPVTYAIQADALGGHTITVPTNGAAISAVERAG